MFLTVIEYTLYVAIALTGSALALGIIHLLWLFVFYPVYRPICVRTFTEMPHLQAVPRPVIDWAEECEFKTKDGLTLKGAYFRTEANKRKGIIVYCHELTGDRWAAWHYCESLCQDGFDIFAFDFRNHGESDTLASYEPLPWTTEFEWWDLEAALDYLESRDDYDSNGVGIMGISKGGTTAIYGAIHDQRIKALVTDGGFGVMGLGVVHLRRYARILTSLSFITDRFPNWWLGWHLRIAFFEIEKLHHCKFIHIESGLRSLNIPVLMIHGKEDRFIPLEASELISSKLPQLEEFWLVPKAKHNFCKSAAPEEYSEHLRFFFQNTFPSIPSQETEELVSVPN